LLSNLKKKYFFFTALLKDVENSPYEMLGYHTMDVERMSLYPNLDYKQLYNALSNLSDVIPTIHSHGLQGLISKLIYLQLYF
jgi:hypothetical protein